MKMRWIGWTFLVMILALGRAGVASAEGSPAPDNTSDGSAPTPENSPAPESIDSLEERMFAEVNAERAKGGVPALELHQWARSIAREHSGKMAAARSIWHNDDYFTQGRKAMGANFFGENVAANGSIQSAHSKLMESPHHRDNILDPRFSHLGIGIARGDDGMVYVSQDFARIPVAANPSTIEPKLQKTAAPDTATATSTATEPGAEGVALVVVQIEAPLPGTALSEDDVSTPDGGDFVLSAAHTSPPEATALISLCILAGMTLIRRWIRRSRRTMAHLDGRVRALFSELGEAK